MQGTDSHIVVSTLGSDLFDAPQRPAPAFEVRFSVLLLPQIGRLTNGREVNLDNREREI